MGRVLPGLEVLLSEPPAFLAGASLGLLTHPAATDHCYRAAKDLVAQRFPGQLKVLFSPQHGLRGEKQDNMVPSPDYSDPDLHLPVISLYGPRLEPPQEILQTLDVVLVDLQDVGTRVYTYGATLIRLMKAASAAGSKVVVLDRPNPLGGDQLEGNLLKMEWASLVGSYPVPMRHGFTLGELAQYVNKTQNLDCDLTVIPAKGWQRSQYFDETGLPWVMPSPNLPVWEGTLVYPGQVLLEGTNLSEGRGTTRPFEIFGAPFLEPPRILKALQAHPLAGLTLRPLGFEPTFHKWAGKLCQGFQLHITDRRTFKPYFTTLSLLKIILELYPKDFAWRPPPYEYETARLPFDLLTGDAAIRHALVQGLPVPDLETSWLTELKRFADTRQEFLLY